MRTALSKCTTGSNRIRPPGRLCVFAPGSYELRGCLDVGRFPLTITSSPDGSRGYVSAVLSSTVTVVDLECLDVLATLNVDRRGEPGAHGLAYLSTPRLHPHG